MSNLFDKHPELIDVAKKLNNFKHYERLSTSGTIVESWDKDKNGEWHDNTIKAREIQHAKLELKAAQADMHRQQMLAYYAAKREVEANGQT